MADQLQKPLLLSYDSLKAGEGSPSLSDSSAWTNDVYRLWSKHTGLLSVLWVVSSLLIVVYVPLATIPFPLMLVPLTASGISIAAVVVLCCCRQPTDAGGPSMTEQVDLAFACAAVAACVDLLAIVAQSIMCMRSTAYISDAGPTPDAVYMLLFACNCWQHAMTSFVVLQSAYQAREWLAAIAARPAAHWSASDVSHSGCVIHVEC